MLGGAGFYLVSGFLCARHGALCWDIRSASAQARSNGRPSETSLPRVACLDRWVDRSIDRNRGRERERETDEDQSLEFRWSFRGLVKSPSADMRVVTATAGSVARILSQTGDMMLDHVSASLLAPSRWRFVLSQSFFIMGSLVLHCSRHRLCPVFEVRCSQLSQWQSGAFPQDQHGGKLPCTLSTFGFGYELDTPLLLQLAPIAAV